MTSKKEVTSYENLKELEGSAFAGRKISDEQLLEIGNYYLSGSYLLKNLDIIRQEKQKALEILADIEAAEKRILNKIALHQNIST
jgi:hypothetical protein